MAVEKIKFGTSGWRGVIADDFTVARVRVVTQDVAVLERSRLAFVRVADEILLARELARHEAPLQARGEAGPAAPAQVRALHLLDDRLGRHPQPLAELRVAAALAVDLERGRVLLPHVLEENVLAGALRPLEAAAHRLARQHAVEVARELASEGISIAGVRLDSGDLDALSRAVRSILDDADLRDVGILASGDLDEYRVAGLVAARAPIDAFGVGTQMGTSADAPWLGVVYKLVADERGPKLKLSEGKATWPGRKQVFRFDDHDIVGLLDESCDGRPIIVEAEAEPIDVIAERCRTAVARLPQRLRSLDHADPPYEVRLSPGLAALVERLSAEQH